MTHRRSFRSAVLTLGLALLSLGAAGSASGQDVDPRWLPWLGCWAPSADNTGVDLVCVQPSEQAGAVELLRVVEGAVASREVLWADGRRHDTSRESCEGWEEGHFSADGRRLFTRGEYVCEGMTQQVAGVIAMASSVAWIDVRTAGMGGENVAWVQRYHAAPAAEVEAAGFGDILGERAWAVATARMVAAHTLDVDDLIEASGALPPEAVEALVAERQDRFELTSDDLIRMADAGVADDVIDVAIAVSYPERFQLRTDQDQVAVSALDTGSLRRRWTRPAAFMGPAFYDPFYMPWSLRYGYGYRSWYGWDPYGYGWSYGGYRPTVVVVDQVERDHGRVVNGRGYTRGRSYSGGSRDAGGSYAPARSGATGSGSAQPSTGSSGASSRGSDTGRTARRRGGGE